MNAQEQALYDSWLHWKDNERTFAVCSIMYIAFNWSWTWFTKNCQRTPCALCRLYYEDYCSGCPLDDEMYFCCIEWDCIRKSMLDNYDYTELHHITAVRVRLEKECKDRGIL